MRRMRMSGGLGEHRFQATKFGAPMLVGDEVVRVSDLPDASGTNCSVQPYQEAVGPDFEVTLFTNGCCGMGTAFIDIEGNIKVLVTGLGGLDGIAQLEDGSILITDWKASSLLWWDKKAGIKKLATGFKGPADFCVVPEAQGLMVVVPDLVKSELRMIHLSR